MRVLRLQRVESEPGRGWQTSPGGLVSALEPILRQRAGSWVGWSGIAGDDARPFVHEDIRQVPVPVSAEELETFYLGFSNKTLWPLYHDAVRPPAFHRRWWGPYVQVNRRFAEAAAAQWQPGDLIWVHDYHLQLVPGFLRELCPGARIGSFLHIPFPPVELFSQLPWRRQLLEGMLGADLLGFQTRYGASNFSRAARRFTSARGTDKLLEYGERWVRVEGIPISIDIERYEQLAADPRTIERARAIRADLGPDRKLFLGVDRLDYTKGIDVRLRAFETFLAQNEELADQVVLVQVAVPSREEVSEYAAIRDTVEGQVGRINGRWGKPGHVPVHYLYRSLPMEELVAFYVAADVMCVTPFRDGMNLVAKEYVACKLADDGVLVLSEFAGAAGEFQSALLVNPHDVDGVARALDRAVHMEPAERERRMGRLRSRLHKNSVHDWANRFLGLLAQ